MNKKAVVFWIIALFLLASCGGSSEAEPDVPAADNSSSSSTESEATEADEEETTAPETTEEDATEASEEPAAEESSETEAAVEASSEEAAPAEEAAAPASPFGDRPMTGTDPETSLPVNPDSVSPGDTFIIRGEIISMNLTPTTSPEFLIQAPDGLKFRIRSQDLAETFYEDGDQLQPFQYRNGLLAQATAMLAADAGLSDIPTSTDLVLIKEE